ncbi:MAG TPA: alkaline phosphatase family protein [Kofleriaceae bacterium]|nr:alkaline phosphatase family protein [Kofleriaceae bacterium]
MKGARLVDDVDRGVARPVPRRLGALAAAVVLLLTSGAGLAFAEPARKTATPIQHLIVVVGENLSFDNLFGTFEPAPGQTVANLLSRGIVTKDGAPGPHYALGAQKIGAASGRYEVTPAIAGAYQTLPRPGTTYARGLPRNQPDTRFPDDLPNGPYRITRYVPYTAIVGDPLHRFFQMWQQLDGGKRDLFTWVAMTSGYGAIERGNPAAGTGQGGVAMGYYDMAAGDAPYFAKLARTWALADNDHQPIMGGTGANYFALATGDVAAFQDDGRLARPSENRIENPEPVAGTANWYTQPGRAGSYTGCADPSQPGVRAIRDYLAKLPYKAWRDGNCAPGAYYLVNNYPPAYTFDGALRWKTLRSPVLPPQTMPNIGSELAAAGVSWKWYSGGRIGDGIDKARYCPICDPLTRFTSVMTTELRARLVGLDAFERDLADAATFPAVSFVVPPNPDSGHPAFSTVAEFETFVRGVVTKVQARPELWKSTAILVTTDESGGSWDSGYVQILDFFGDGTRIPLIAVSPWAKKGYVDHTYYDHVSILKFIEKNWRLAPLSARSRDNLPNPVPSAADPYVPANRPAIGDLMGLFAF